MNKIFTDIAWEDYQYWQLTDKKIIKKFSVVALVIVGYRNFLTITVVYTRK